MSVSDVDSLEGLALTNITKDYLRSLMKEKKAMPYAARSKARLETELREIRAALKSRARFDEEDPFEDGAVLTFDKKMYGGGGQVYTYAALRADDAWFLTGTREKQALNWDELIGFVGDADVYFCATADQVY